jgi:molecular chaperone DnaK
VQQFSTYADNQESIEVDTFLGERKLAKDNLLLAKARLSGLAKKPRGELQIEVAFEL